MEKGDQISPPNEILKLIEKRLSELIDYRKEQKVESKKQINQELNQTCKEVDKNKGKDTSNENGNNKHIQKESDELTKIKDKELNNLSHLSNSIVQFIFKI